MFLYNTNAWISLNGPESDQCFFFLVFPDPEGVLNPFSLLFSSVNKRIYRKSSILGLDGS